MDDSAKNKQKNPGQGASAAELGPDGRHALALRAIKTLEDAGYEARLAGGCVRDRLLGIKPKDYDVATTAWPEQICTVFKQKNIKVVPTGIDHGTITVVMAGQGMEVTSLRRDVSTDGRRATVAFGSSFEEDAERRDFTFNAMFEDNQGRIYDFFGGREDLNLGRLRFVGVAHERIREDYLRIMRMFRFWSRFGFTPDAPTLEACRQEGQGLRMVSQERITHELMETLQGDHVMPAMSAMSSTGILDLVLGITSLPKDLLTTLDALKISTKEERAPARLGLLLQLKWGDNAKAFEEAMQNLRLSRAIQNKVVLSMFVPLDKIGHDPGEMMDHIDVWETHGASFLETLLPLWRVMYPKHKSVLDELEGIEARHGHRRRTKLPLDGQTLIAQCGAKPGPQLGLLLVELKRRWRVGEWQTRDEGLVLAQKLLDSYDS
ncbi:MAG TPA: CCA tRNA nucleotidyltransferase [Oligoflexus sp.]|uniref:CCA tRNA nucleotidyltransferase n=1 Tax=Oligoflexus sp. TaxID=1971216 RepID=UPI002D56E408|nr:CCA tRNA nucleotidyltransferase [Oligoflexus sp.]HYX34976.1 CCA tRNA nucleotidyltransferase [Oligoflexus sp.]